MVGIKSKIWFTIVEFCMTIAVLKASTALAPHPFLYQVNFEEIIRTFETHTLSHCSHWRQGVTHHEGTLGDWGVNNCFFRIDLGVETLSHE